MPSHFLRSLIALAFCLFPQKGMSGVPLRIVTENWPPVSFEKAGEAQGMAVELARLIQQRVKTKEPIEVLPWPRAYQMVFSQPNVVLFTVVRTPERESLLSSLGPVARGQIAVFTRADFNPEKSSPEEQPFIRHWRPRVSSRSYP